MIVVYSKSTFILLVARSINDKFIFNYNIKQITLNSTVFIRVALLIQCSIEMTECWMNQITEENTNLIALPFKQKEINTTNAFSIV